MLRQSTSRLVQSAAAGLRVAPSSSSKLASRTFASSAARLESFGEADKALFDKHVVQGKNLTIVDFHADWCPPCKMLDPILSKVMGTEEEADYMKINTDNEQEIAAKYKVSALPTVIAFKHGKELSRFVGLVNEDAVKNFVANAKDH